MVMNFNVHMVSVWDNGNNIPIVLDLLDYVLFLCHFRCYGAVSYMVSKIA